jgi:hypothetical protein
LFHLTAKPPNFYSLLNAMQQIFGIERLCEIIVGALLGRLHRTGDRTVCGQDEHRQMRMSLQEFL